MAGKYVYRVASGTLDLHRDELIQAGEAFEMDDDEAERVMREVPDVVPESVIQEEEAQNEEAKKQAEALTEAENASRETAADDLQAEATNEEGVQERSRREGAASKNPVPDANRGA